MSGEIDNLGVVLTGGGSPRAGEGGDKPLAVVGGRTLLSRVLERAAPQCGRTVISANSDNPGYSAAGLPVVRPNQAAGAPLAGILAAMDWAAMNAPGCGWVVSFAGDAPFIPRDMSERLADALANAPKGGADMARASSFGRRHSVFGLWPVSVRAELRDRLVNHGVGDIDLFTADYRVADVEFDGIPDPFFSVETIEDRAEAERIIAAGG